MATDKTKSKKKKASTKKPSSTLPVRAGESRPALKSPLDKYMQEVSRYPLLSQEEELTAAIAHYENQDREAAHRLVTANLRLVVKIAHDFRRARLSILDLIQEGNYGLMKAVQKYNPYKGVKLSSYAAWWIKAYILKFLMDNKSQVKMGTTAAQRKLFYNLQKETQRLLQKYERVTPKLLAESLDVKESEVVEMQKRLGSPDVSMDAPMKGSDGSEGEIRANLIPDENISIEEGFSQSQVAEIFSEHLSSFEETLKGRDLQIFKERILAENPKTLREIGESLGVTRERARQLESRIIKNLKKFVEEDGRLTQFSEI